MVTFFVFFLNGLMTFVLVVSLSYHYYKRLSQNKFFQTAVFKLHAWIKASQSAGRRKSSSNNNNDDMEFELEMDDFNFTEDKCMLLLFITPFSLPFFLFFV